jgi:CsoR family transcriptional regulator, copper-sensing transcriptional repressor
MHLSEDKRSDVRRRLSRIEGQVRGLQRMIDDDRYCGDILAQFASCKSVAGYGRHYHAQSSRDVRDGCHPLG